MDNRKKTLIKVGAIMALVLIGIAAYYITNNYFFVETEDARISGDIAKINAQITGKLVSSDLEEGTTVKKDQIVARQEAPNLTDTGLETTLLRSPIDGVVIKKQGVIGEIATAGSTIGMVINPKALYVLANIDETKLGKLKEGQLVDVKIDAYPGKKFIGHVSQIGEAANSTFSLLASSSSGNFTKVVQKVAVKVAIDAGQFTLRPGTNAVIKIHVH